MSNTRVWTWVDAGEAVRAGHSQSGICSLQITDDELGALCDEDRALLASAATSADTAPERRFVVGGEYACEAKLAEPTLPAVLAFLRDAEARRKAKAAKDAANREEDRQRALRACDVVWCGQKTNSQGAADWPATAYEEASRAKAEFRRRPDVAAWEAELAATVERQAREQRAASAAAQQEREAASAAAAQQYSEACEALVREIGSQDQIERLAEYMLPDDEMAAIVHDHVFAHFSGLGRYVRLNSGDLEHGEECHVPDPRFEVEEADSATADQWRRLKGLRPTWAEGGSATLRRHVATCDCDGCGARTERCSIRVAIPWHGRTLTREYADADRDQQQAPPVGAVGLD